MTKYYSRYCFLIYFLKYKVDCLTANKPNFCLTTCRKYRIKYPVSNYYYYHSFFEEMAEYY